MSLLPTKSWNPRSAKNRARVERDEAEAKAQELSKALAAKRREAEWNYAQLKASNKLLSSEESKMVPVEEFKEDKIESKAVAAIHEIVTPSVGQLVPKAQKHENIEDSSRQNRVEPYSSVSSEKSPLEQLRQERLQRERAERIKAAKLLQKPIRSSSRGRATHYGLLRGED